MAEFKLPSDEEIRQAVRSLNIEDSELQLGMEYLSGSPDLANEVLTTVNAPHFMDRNVSHEEMVVMALKELRDRHEAEFKAFWTITVGGVDGVVDPDYLGVNHEWAQSEADPAFLADKFGYEFAESGGSGGIARISEEAFDHSMELRTEMLNRFGSESQQEAFREKAAREYQLRELPVADRETLRKSDELTSGLEDPDVTQKAREGSGGLLQAREMEILTGYIRGQRDLFGFHGPEAIGDLLKQSAEGKLGLPIRGTDIGARARVKLNPDQLGLTHRDMVSTMSAGPLPFLENGINELGDPNIVGEAKAFQEFEAGGGGDSALIEPVENRIGSGGFQTEAQTLQRTSGGEFTLEEMISAYYTMGDEALENFQRDLWRMGYFGQEAIDKGLIPQWGIRDRRTKDAYFSMVYDLLATDHNDYNILRNNKIRENYNQFAQLKKDILGLNDQGELTPIDVPGIQASMAVLNDVDVEAQVQTQAQAVIGKKLKEDELKSVIKVLRSLEGEELNQRVAHAKAGQQAEVEVAERQSKRTRWEAHSGVIKIYDENGELITPTINPNRGFNPETVAKGGALVEPVAGFEETGKVNPVPDDLVGYSPEGNIVGRDVVSTIEQAPTASNLAVQQLRRNQGSQVFARDMARRIGVLRGMVGNTIPGSR